MLRLHQNFRYYRMFNKNYDHQFTFHFDVLILYKFISREKIIRNSSIYPSSFIQKFLSHRASRKRIFMKKFSQKDHVTPSFKYSINQSQKKKKKKHNEKFDDLNHHGHKVPSGIFQLAKQRPHKSAESRQLSRGSPWQMHYLIPAVAARLSTRLCTCVSREDLRGINKGINKNEQTRVPQITRRRADETRGTPRRKRARSRIAARRDGIIQRVFQLCMPFLAFPCAKYSYSARGSFFFSLIDLFGVEILLRMMIFGIS